MKLTDIFAWWAVIRVALAARVHPDATPPATADDDAGKKFLGWLARVLTIISALSWLMIRYRGLMTADLSTLRDAFAPLSAEVAATFAAQIAMLGRYNPDPAEGTLLLPVFVLNLIPVVPALLISVWVTQQVATPARGWRIAVGIGLSAAASAAVWGLVLVWAVIQLLRHSPVVPMVSEVSRLLAAGDAAAAQHALDRMTPWYVVHMAAMNLLALGALLPIAVCVARGLHAQGARWRAAVPASILPLVAMTATSYAEQHFALRGFIRAMFTV
jgi:hypothetical protein